MSREFVWVGPKATLVGDRVRESLLFQRTPLATPRGRKSVVWKPTSFTVFGLHHTEYDVVPHNPVSRDLLASWCTGSRHYPSRWIPVSWYPPTDSTRNLNQKDPNVVSRLWKLFNETKDLKLKPIIVMKDPYSSGVSRLLSSHTCGSFSKTKESVLRTFIEVRPKE